MFDSPDQELTWVGFATVVTVMCGSSLTLVTNIADLTRYMRSRRDMRVGLIASTLAATAATTLIGGVYAVGSGETNPFVAAAGLTSNDAVLVVLLLAIVVQTFAANVTNVLHRWALARLEPPVARTRRRDRGRGARGDRPLGLPVADRGGAGVGHAPRQRRRSADRRRPGRLPRPARGRLDVEALFDPVGRYRYVRGVNVEAVVAVAFAVAVYYAVPDAWLKVAWGLGAGAAAYLALTGILRPGTSRAAKEPA